MATDISNIQNIHTVFKSIADRHKFIRGSFGWGQDSSIGASEEIQYPLLWVKPTAATMLKSEEQDRYAAFEVELEVKVVDQIIKDNVVNVGIENDSLQTLREIITEFNDHPFYQEGFMLLVEDVNFEPLDEFNDDLASGWQGVLTLKMRNPQSLCSLPVENLTGYFYSGGCSSSSIQSTYLTCATLTACTSFQDFIDAAIAGITDNNYYTTGASYSNGSISFDRTDQASAYTVDLSALVVDNDNFTTGATLANGNLSFNRTNQLSAYTVDLSSLSGSNTFTTASTYSAGLITFNKNDGTSYTADLSNLSATTLYVTNEAWTIELIDAQTTSFYAPYALAINSITNVLNAPTITLQDDGVSYSLGATIATGSKIGITASTASVVTLNVTR